MSKAYEYCDVELDTSMEGVVDVSTDKSNGVVKKVITEGTGDLVPNGSKVSVHYVGTLPTTGEIFDSSRSRDSPFEFDLGQGRVIKGWDQGVASMRVGERAVLTCQPDFAYGSSGQGKIPANAVLNFEVEVLDFKENIESLSSASKVEKATQLKEKAGEAFRNSDFLNALKLYEDALDFVRDFWDADSTLSDKGTSLEAILSNNQATVYRVLKNWTASKKSADRAVELDNKNPKYVLSQAIANTNLKNFTVAAEQFEKIRTLNGWNDRAAKAEKKLFKAQKHYEQREKLRYKNLFARYTAISVAEEESKKKASAAEETTPSEDTPSSESNQDVSPEEISSEASN